MPCGECERGMITDCGFMPTFSYDAYSMEHDVTCKGFIPGTPGDFVILSCKIRLGIFWLFSPITEENEGLETWDDLSMGIPWPGVTRNDDWN